MVEDSPPLQAKVGLSCYLGLNSGLSVSLNVKKTRKHFSRNSHGARVFPQCSHFPIKGTLFPVSVFVFKMEIMLTLHGREF